MFRLPSFFSKKIKQANIKGLSKNPFFYFGLISVVLFASLYVACNSYASSGTLADNKTVFLNSFLNTPNAQSPDSLFFSQNDEIALETPDLKILQDNTISGISIPSVISAKVLGDEFGGNQNNKKDIINYTVQPGDTFQSIALANNIALNTLLWANDVTASSQITVGEKLTILPVDGVLHAVTSGDTLGAIAQTYKADENDIIAFNGLANQDDIYIGDILVVPGGVMPKKTVTPIVSNQVPVAGNYYIFPAQGIITQGLHYYNAIDLANQCGTPIYAAASGTVQRAVGNGLWNLGMGNYITILHGNGTVTYYGHLSALLVKPGDVVNVGQNIGLMGRTGDATGCHVHFEVIGATNPLARYSLGNKNKLYWRK